mgnify:CR=1 FL=1
MQFFSDYMDEACQFKVGHTNWSYVSSVHPDEVADGDIEAIIVIYKDDDRGEMESYMTWLDMTNKVPAG